MNNDLKVFDAHLHFFSGNKDDLMQIISSSPYKDKYMGYSSVNYDYINIDLYIEKLNGAFVIPLIIKETDIAKSNHLLFEYVTEQKQKEGIYPIPLIDECDDCIKYIDKAIGAKEHFVLHNAFTCEKRANAYKRLNESNKFLILHCKDGLRDEYVKFLLREYKNLKIILAHLGANRKFKEWTFDTITKFADNERVFFDTSTIFDTEILNFACATVSNDKILFGTDIPFILGNDCEVATINSILNLNISKTEKENIFYNNVKQLINNNL